jgi:hypothetical protein
MTRQQNLVRILNFLFMSPVFLEHLHVPNVFLISTINFCYIINKLIILLDDSY